MTKETLAAAIFELDRRLGGYLSHVKSFADLSVRDKDTYLDEADSLLRSPVTDWPRALASLASPLTQAPAATTVAPDSGRASP